MLSFVSDTTKEKSYIDMIVIVIIVYWESLL